MKRLLTAAVAVPLALAAIFGLGPLGFFIVCALTLGWAASEFVSLARAWSPQAPLGLLPFLAVLLGGALSYAPIPDAVAGPGVATVAVLLPVGLGSLLLFSRTPVSQVPAALGAFAFGLPYFAVPMASLYHLQRRDPWLVLLLVAIVWLGDTAAYYVGSSWGRHRLAPVVSPKKSWEGAIAGLVISSLATLIWALWRLGSVPLGVMVLGLATAVAAQVGDLVESVFKRGSGIKDSGNVLPGHGGVLDRADALLFAAPVLWLGWLWIEEGGGWR